jgi:hypothetical protein
MNGQCKGICTSAFKAIAHRNQRVRLNREGIAREL